MKWTDDRVAEYHLMVQLVGIVRGLNHTTNIIGKIQRLEEIVSILTKTDLASPCKMDFMDFLKERIREDRMVVKI